MDLISRRYYISLYRQPSLPFPNLKKKKNEHAKITRFYFGPEIQVTITQQKQFTCSLKAI